MVLELDQPKPRVVVHLASPIEGLAICGRPLGAGVRWIPRYMPILPKGERVCYWCDRMRFRR